MRRLICAFVVRIWQKQVFSWRGSYDFESLKSLILDNVLYPTINALHFYSLNNLIMSETWKSSGHDLMSTMSVTYVYSQTGPKLKTTSMRPPVIRDHLQILPRVITITFKRPETTFLPQNKILLLRPLSPLDLKFYVKTYFNWIDWNFKFDDEIRLINYCDDLFNLFAFHFQNSSVFMKNTEKQWAYCNNLHALSTICLWGY